MTDELDDLKALMTAATPAPDRARRAENLALAQKNFADIQGSTDQRRPISVTGLRGLWTGLKTMMNTLTTRGGLATTTALVACGFVALTSIGQNLWQSTSDLPATLTQPRTEASLGDDLDQNIAAAPGNFSTAQVAEEEIEIIEDDSIADLAPETMEAAVVAVSPQPEPRSRAASPAPAPSFSFAPSSGVAADMIAPLGRDIVSAVPAEIDTESYPQVADNPVKVTTETPVSTFSIDVDTASYGILRSSLTRGQLPPKDAVRVEEMINYFPYDYPAPQSDAAPFQPTLSVFPTPWNADTQLVHIALQGTLPDVETRPPLNLVFLIDTSGSMDDPTKLPLLKQSFRLMLDNLRPEDEVAIVEYAGSAGQVLAPTNASDRNTILAAINGLGAGGSTNGQGGLQQAYAVADQMTQDGEVNRVILATDGDFNVGLDSPDALKDYIADKRETGTFLSVLGFGRGNLNDTTMQALAQNGNGQAAYIDTLSEAQKVLVDQLTGALFTIASDVKVQVEFNPAQIAEYRLIGYETRALRREDFNNDAVDAGELGAGHSVTALYEVSPVGSPALLNDPLRYQSETVAETSSELGFVKLRWKAPGESASQLIQAPISAANGPTQDAQFAAAIAGFGQLLRDGAYLGTWSYDDAIALASQNRGDDPYGYRTEAVQLMRLAQSLSRR